MRSAVARSGLEDTIVACATAPGPGAIAIVRLSGRDAAAIARTLRGGAALPPAHRLARADLFAADGALIDAGMAVSMPGPHSFTGEDVVELHVHGGRAVLTAVLAACRAAGARDAEPGEFTRRAFVHGQLDLAQAEAVGALVRAADDAERLAALAVLQGGLSSTVHGLLHELEGVAAAWLADLDFPADAGDEALPTPAHRATCAAAAATLDGLLGGLERAAARRQGVVLLGAPNTGKSTLINAWAGEERALVDDAPGTTRDAIEVPLWAPGVAFSAWDSAGWRTAAGAIEARGIALGAARAQQAAVRVWLIDAASPQWPPDALEPVWLVGARWDRWSATSREALEAEAEARGTPLWGWVSGQAGHNVDALRVALAEALQQHAHEAGAPVLPSPRHRAHLVEARAALGALDAPEQGAAMPLDLLLAELQRGIWALGALVGRDVDAGVIDRIFRDFCIGK